MKTTPSAMRTVDQIMTGDVRMIKVSDSLRPARDLMLSMAIHALPVVDADGALVGIVTSHDLVDDELSFEDESTIGEIMASPVVTIDVEASIGEAAETMRAERIHHLVVVEEGIPVGILSTFDLLQLLA